MCHVCFIWHYSINSCLMHRSHDRALSKFWRYVWAFKCVHRQTSATISVGFQVYLENLRCVTSWGMVATSIRQDDCTSIPSIFFLRTVLVYFKIFHHARRTSAVDTPIELTDNFVDSLTMLDTHTSHDCGVVWGRDFWHSSSLFDKYMLHISHTHTHTHCWINSAL
jgi:hypothetical protein